MSPELRKHAFIILAVIAGCIASVIPINKRINLGLDLKGGMHLVLQVQNDKLPTARAREDAEEAVSGSSRFARSRAHARLRGLALDANRTSSRSPGASAIMRRIFGSSPIIRSSISSENFLNLSG